jgi:hypothetical protein
MSDGTQPSRIDAAAAQVDNEIILNRARGPDFHANAYDHDADEVDNDMYQRDSGADHTCVQSDRPIRNKRQWSISGMTL